MLEDTRQPTQNSWLSQIGPMSPLPETQNSIQSINRDVISLSIREIRKWADHLGSSFRMSRTVEQSRRHLLCNDKGRPFGKRAAHVSSAR